MIVRVLGISLVAAGLFLAAATADSPVPPGTGTKRTITFRNGVEGYKGTVDLEIWAVSPNTCLEGNINASSDANNDGGESQVLMRFDHIIGNKPSLLPPHATIHSAMLVVGAFDEGTTVHLHRMLVPWNKDRNLEQPDRWNHCRRTRSIQAERRIHLRQDFRQHIGHSF